MLMTQRRIGAPVPPISGDYSQAELGRVKPLVMSSGFSFRVTFVM